MKVSVIIPVYNTARYLPECLDSVLAQTHQDFEAILVDDGSTDGSGDICDDYAARDSRIRVLHCANGGQSVARNIGIEQATGESLCFVDSDDMMSPDMLDVLVATMQASRVDIVSSGYSHGVVSRFTPFVSNNIRIYSSEEAVAMFLYQKSGISVGPWAHLFNANLFKGGLRFVRGIIYEDLDLIPKLYEKANKVAFVKSKLYFYRYLIDSSINTWSRRRLDVLDVTERLEEYFSYSRELHAAAADRRMSAAFNILLLNARNESDPEVERRCMDIIRRRRAASLLNPRVRLKNKLGALMSYLGVAPLKFMSRFA